jgi:hypothetical protein
MPAAVDRPAPDSTRILLKEAKRRANASTEGTPSGGNTLATCIAVITSQLLQHEL